jgi:hypothetical protein
MWCCRLAKTGSPCTAAPAATEPPAAADEEEAGVAADLDATLGISLCWACG